MIEGSEHEELFNTRFSMALELTAVADLDTIMDAIDILYSVDWDYDRAVSLLDGRNSANPQ